MGKSTISTGPFSSSQTVNVYQAGYNWGGTTERGIENDISNELWRSVASQGVVNTSKRLGLVGALEHTFF